jgi:hypothetical protein
MFDEIDDSERFSLQFDGYDEDGESERREPNEGSAVLGYDPSKDQRRKQQGDMQIA